MARCNKRQSREVVLPKTWYNSFILGNTKCCNIVTWNLSLSCRTHNVVTRGLFASRFSFSVKYSKVRETTVWLWTLPFLHKNGIAIHKMHRFSSIRSMAYLCSTRWRSNLQGNASWVYGRHDPPYVYWKQWVQIGYREMVMFSGDLDMVYYCESWDCLSRNSKQIFMDDRGNLHPVHSLISKLHQFCMPLNMIRYPSLLYKFFLNWDIFIDWYIIRMISCHVVCMEGAVETLHCVRWESACRP